MFGYTATCAECHDKGIITIRVNKPKTFKIELNRPFSLDGPHIQTAQVRCPRGCEIAWKPRYGVKASKTVVDWARVIRIANLEANR